MTNVIALLVQWSVRQKINRVSSVQFSYVAQYAPLHWIEITLYLTRQKRQ